MLPKELCLLATPNSPQHVLPDTHVHRACLAWWLWQLCFLSPLLDKSLYPLWQWDWMAFWGKLSLGNWSHYERLGWDDGTTGIQLSGRRRRSSLPAAEESVCNEREEWGKRRRRRRKHVCVWVPLSGAHVWRPEVNASIFYWSPSCLFLFEIRSSLNPKLVFWGGQQGLKVFLYPPFPHLQHKSHGRHLPLCPAFTWVLILTLTPKYFTH